MTIEFWPRRLLRPRSRAKKPPKKRKPKRPRLPIGAGKAQQLLSSAILRSDHELASWVDSVVKRSLVTGTPGCVDDLKQRLDAVMEPLPDASSPHDPKPTTGNCPAL